LTYAQSPKRFWIIAYSLVFIALAGVLPGFHLVLPIGSTDFSSAPVTVAAVLLPWPVAVLAGIIKGIGSALWGGSFLIEVPAGLGEALAALFTCWLVKRWQRYPAVIGGQISRFIFSGGIVSLFVGLGVAYGAISPGLSPIGNLTASAWQNISIVFKDISYPTMVLSVGVNLITALFAVWLLGEIVEITVYGK
jgi:hypothetical protein